MSGISQILFLVKLLPSVVLPLIKISSLASGPLLTSQIKLSSRSKLAKKMWRSTDLGIWSVQTQEAVGRYWRGQLGVNTVPFEDPINFVLQFVEGSSFVTLLSEV